MKKIQLLLISFLLLTCHLSMAQLAKGNIQIGGTVGFDIQFVENGDNLFSLMLNPSVASFINDNVAVGGTLGLSYLKSGDFSTSVLNVLPLARYYLPGPTESTAFFAEAKAGLAIVSVDLGAADESESALQFAIGPGIAYFISDDVSIDALLAFNRIGGDIDQSNLLFNVGLQVFLIKDGE